ncbi:MAG: Mur ligase family protein [Bradymonadia bacterium]
MTGPSDAQLVERQRVAHFAALRRLCITGTNGKTSTAGLVDAMLGAAGRHRAQVTTLGASLDGTPIRTGVDFDAFADAVDGLPEGGELILEVTSESLAEGFCWRWPPHIAAVTHVTRDHLDVHGTLERYLAAKGQLLMALPAEGVAVLNANCPSSALLSELVPPGVQLLTFALADEPRHLEGTPTLTAQEIVDTPQGVRVHLAPSPLAERLGGMLQLSVSGTFQGPNVLAAALVAHSAGVQPEHISRGAHAFCGVRGRFEIVGGPPKVIVDYAHNPDGLQRALQAARQHLDPGGRLWCLFGAGGERDAGKRPLMGVVAATEADQVYLTADNPRHESAAHIAEEIKSGADALDVACEWVYISDRRRAIEAIITAAQPGDVVLLAGRGHERTQQVGDRVIDFDEIEEARAALSQRNDDR